MRGKISIMLLFLLGLSPVFALNEGDVAPDFSLENLVGESVSISQYRGKVVYLDFWASWCPPCRGGLDFVQKLSAKYKADQIVILAVNLDTDREKALDFLDSPKPPFTVLFDPKQAVPEKYALPAMPTSFLIGRDGTIRSVHVGFRNGDEAVLEAQVAAALAP